MAISDETPLHRQGKTEQKICQSTTTNPTTEAYLNPSRYPMRPGNVFKTYISGEKVFADIAESIRNAKRSIDIVSWGFDPAIPLDRSTDAYKYNYVDVFDPGSQMALPPWANVPADQIPGVKPGFILTQLDESIDLYTANVRKDDAGRPIIYSPWREEDSYGALLLKALKDNEELEVRIVIWYYGGNAAKGEVQNMVGVGHDTWLREVSLNGIEPKKFTRNTGFVRTDYDEHYGLTSSPFRYRTPAAQDYSREWFRKISSDEFPGHDRIAFVFRRIQDGGRDLPEEDNRYNDGTGAFGESTTLSIPTDHQKTILIDFEDDDKRHAYVMGHNSKTEYWSEFPFKHRSVKNELDYLPYHDFSMQVKGQLTIDINENFCDAWESYHATITQVFNNPRMSTPFTPKGERFFPGQTRTDLRTNRRTNYERIRKLSPGEANGQIVRTRPDRNTALNVPEREIKEAYLQVTRTARNYLLMVNQYCQYAKLIRHIKHWRREMINNCTHDKEDQLYIFIGTCKTENDGQVFRAHRMANELGLGNMFPTAEAEMYEGEDMQRRSAGGWKPANVRHQVLSTTEEKIFPTGDELKELNIKPLYFAFYTQAPQGHLAQEVYVHAKLMVQDDGFFTMGSTNLNIRSMAVDSELNLISDDIPTAKELRHTLLGAYVNADASKVEFYTPEQFPNNNQEGVVLGQAALKDMHEKFELRMIDNFQYIEEHKPINGRVAQFQDTRGVLNEVRQG